ncbi:X-ray repair cross-complementing protein 5 [Geranomyces variabilis]|uniref:ATP-dependent DNA helicase II subunit 1 n=1 Tax=Geranomyces variabilis TaxID=109894 RepID=A0AAD5TIC9_9FUNG|nr:X-ray repair cross-complementing protein 5 [Geranomyces variabilis]
MAKYATAIILDVNPSMRELRPGNTKTAQQRATEAIFQILHSKIIAGRKRDVVTLVEVGTAETDNVLADGSDYQHVSAYRFESDDDSDPLLAMADLHLLKYIEQGGARGTGNGDLMDAIVVAVHMLDQHCRHLKFEKRITIFTDAQSPIDNNGWEQVMTKAQAMGVYLSLIGYEFDDPELGIKYEDKPATKNEAFLREMAASLEHTIWSGDTAAEFLNSLRSREVKPVPVFQGPLVLGDAELYPERSISIPVAVYKKTLEAKIPSAKNWSSLAENIPDAPRLDESFGRVDMDRTYKFVVAEDLDPNNVDAGAATGAPDEEDAEVDKADLVRAYKYGKTLVPLSIEDEAAMKLRTVKGMSVIGFVKRELVLRYHYMSEILYVNPQPENAASQRLFPPLMAALRELHWVALTRYVRRDDANPKLGFLMPHESVSLGAEKESALWTQIPFLEDLRLPVFLPLDFLLAPVILSASSVQSHSITINSQSTLDSQRSSGGKAHKMDVRQVPEEEIKNRIDAIIDTMDLMEAADSAKDEFGVSERTEAFKVKSVFNPSIQRLYQCLAHRAIHPDAQLPPVNPDIMACINPIEKLIPAAAPAAEKVKESFLIRKVESKLSGKRAWAETAATAGEGVNPADLLSGDGARPEKIAKVELATTVEELQGRLVEKVSTLSPVDDFERMIKRTDKDCVSDAVAQMCEVITNLVHHSFQSQLYDKAYACVVALRSACVVQEEPAAFDKWLTEFKRDITVGEHPEHAPFWERLRENGVTLIPHNEDNEAPVSEEDAAQFLAKEAEPAAPPPAAMVVDDEEDMLGMMD